MATRDLTDSIVEHLVNVLESGKVDMQIALEAKGYKEESLIKTIYGDEQRMVDVYPSISIVPGNTEEKWLATRTREETYTFYVDCMAKNIKTVEAGRYIRCFANVTRNVLNDFRNLRFTVPHTNFLAWDSFAPRSEYGYKRDGAIRVARITWWCKVVNPVPV